ncbi:MAG: hypothetical protein OEV78_06955 [Spirochaetia bacterium]|nr:hypothetical protein [Spirochaetia bacterium]
MTTHLNEILKTRVANLSMDDAGIVRLTIDHKNGLMPDDLKEILSGISKLAKGKKALIIGHSINFKLPSREVRIFAAEKVNSEVIKAAATISSNSMAVMAANFFLKINQPPFPFKAFSNEKEAIKWLKNFQTKI